MLKIEEIFKVLNEAKIKYLLIGGLASIIYGVPRTTLDIDIAIQPTKTNIKKTIKVLTGLGLTPETTCVDEILGLGGTTFTNEKEIDVLTDLLGTEFEDLWQGKETVVYKTTEIYTVSLNDHLKMLKRAGRKKDFEDIECLEETHD